MATNNLIQVKRTAISGRAANTQTLTNPAEVALNMADGIMYSTNGSVVFEIGANTTNSNVSGNLTVKAIIANNSVGSAGNLLVSNGTVDYWRSLFTASSTPPTNAVYGEIWYSTDDNKPYMLVTDGGGSFWYDFLPA